MSTILDIFIDLSWYILAINRLSIYKMHLNPDSSKRTALLPSSQLFLLKISFVSFALAVVSKILIRIWFLVDTIIRVWNL
jgi:hypothetical protein